MGPNIIFYGIITLILSIFFAKDMLSYQDNGYFPNKEVGEVGLKGTLIIVIEIIFTLIWGGIYWW